LPDGRWQDEAPLADYRSIVRHRGLDALRAELAIHPLFTLRTKDAAAHARVAAALARYRGADLERASIPEAPPIGPDRLARLRLPVLVVNGEFDTPQRLRVGAALEAGIAGARRRIVPDAGHLACLDNPSAYREVVSPFLIANATAGT
jgi:pimeloyl-ACP methyl ester carboxylesterase